MQLTKDMEDAFDRLLREKEAEAAHYEEVIETYEVKRDDVHRELVSIKQTRYLLSGLQRESVYDQT